MYIPQTADALTTAWLTEALGRGQHGRAIKVLSFTTRPLVESKGFFGQVACLTLELEGDATGDISDVPNSLIAKFSSATPEMRRRSVDSYAREVRFYQQLAHTTDLPTPTCYYADIDLESGVHILLLQDLAPMSCGSRVAGCTPDQARLAIHHIAKLHTRWWGKTESAALRWLAPATAEADAEQQRQQYDQWWPLFYQQAKEQLPDALKPFSAALGRHRATLRRRNFNPSPATLIHRDFQLDNLFFGPQGTATAGVAPFAIVDWQFLSFGNGVWDVAYFLSESLLPVDRRAVEMELLTSYHHTLTEHGVADYSFEQCLYDYRLALLQRHTALVSTIAAMPFSDEQRHIHIDILLPRNVEAILDHNAHTLVYP